MKAGWIAASVLLLAACSGAPKKSDPPPAAAAPAAAAPSAAATAAGCTGVSPYAPAQEDPSTRGDYVAGGLYKPGVRDTTPDYLPRVECIPEPEVVHTPRSRTGNRSPYQVLGKSYTVRDSAEGYVETGIASYYGNKFHGRRTSNQEVYDMYAFTAAHKSLPLPSFARVTNLDNGRSVVVRVNDRGPFHEGRVVDLSYAAAVKLDIHRRGTGRVEVRGLVPGENARHRDDAVASASPAPATAGALQLPPGVRIATGKPAPVARGDAAAPRSGIDSLVEALPAATADAGGRTPPPAVAAGGDWRFDMRQDGRTMTADEFDAWMAARQARVATGKPGAPVAVATAPPPAQASAPAAAADTTDAPPGVTLQVAAFAARPNAEHALAMLRGAGVAVARLHDGVWAGKPIWRLRVGPVSASSVPELSSRIAGLGFGTPQIVRD